MWNKLFEINTDISQFFQNKFQEIETIKLLFEENKDRESYVPYSLLSGNFGLSILFNHLYGVKDIEYSDFLIEPAIVSYKSEKQPLFTFCSGVSGMIWGLKYLADQDFISIDRNIQVQQNGTLYKFSLHALGEKNFDYLHGGLGICLNALQFPEEQSSREYLSKVVNILVKDAIKSQNGIAWESTDFESEKPIFNLGLSHGIPSIIAILSLIHEADIEKKQTGDVLERSVSWLLEQKLSKEKLSIFPYAVPVEKKGNINLGSSRLGWCYGDLGIARSIWLAARATGNEEWKKESINIMLHAAKRRNLEENSVWDAGLCHGSAGIAHIFNRFYQDTQIKEFKEAAEYWFQVTLDFAVFEDGIGGYKMFVPGQNESEKGKWQNSAGLLEGSAGIGLALLSAISDIEPKWDRCLLLS